MNWDININRVSCRISFMIFIIAVSINLSAQVNSATSLIESEVINDIILYGEFDSRSANMIWNNKKIINSELSVYYIEQKEEEKKNLLDFLSKIDSLHIIDYINDTIHIFNYGDDFFMESNKYVVAKSTRYWAQNQKQVISNQDSLVCREKGTSTFRVDWLPMYMQNALKEENLGFIATMCKWHEKVDYDKYGYSFAPRTNFIYYKIIIRDGKIVDRKRIEYGFYDHIGIFDDIYDTAERLVADGQEFTLNKMKQYKARNRIKIGRILDSIYNHSCYNRILKRNPEILKWENEYVLSLIDSLNIINYENDTIYYELCYKRNGAGHNRAGILTNLRRMFVYESFNNVVWDTLCGQYMENYYGSEHINSYYHRDMQSKYLFYILTLKYPYNMVLFNTTYDWRKDYDYKLNLFKEDRNNKKYNQFNDGRNKSSDKRLSKTKMLYNKNISENDFIRIITRIEFKDGNVVKAVTQMRIGEFYIWNFT